MVLEGTKQMLAGQPQRQLQAAIAARQAANYERNMKLQQTQQAIQGFINAYMAQQDRATEQQRFERQMGAQQSQFEQEMALRQRQQMEAERAALAQEGFTGRRVAVEEAVGEESVQASAQERGFREQEQPLRIQALRLSNVAKNAETRALLQKMDQGEQLFPYELQYLQAQVNAENARTALVIKQEEGLDQEILYKAQAQPFVLQQKRAEAGLTDAQYNDFLASESYRRGMRNLEVLGLDEALSRAVVERAFLEQTLDARVRGVQAGTDLTEANVSQVLAQTGLTEAQLAMVNEQLADYRNSEDYRRRREDLEIQGMSAENTARLLDVDFARKTLDDRIRKVGAESGILESERFVAEATEETRIANAQLQRQLGQFQVEGAQIDKQIGEANLRIAAREADELMGQGRTGRAEALEYLQERQKAADRAIRGLVGAEGITYTEDGIAVFSETAKKELSKAQLQELQRQLAMRDNASSAIARIDTITDAELYGPLGNGTYLTWAANALITGGQSAQPNRQPAQGTSGGAEGSQFF